MKFAVTLAALATAQALVPPGYTPTGAGSNCCEPSSYGIEAPALSGWKTVGKADSEKTIPVIISLKKDTSAVAKFVDDVATPGSRNFRKWATSEQLRKLRHVEDATPILRFLKKEGIDAQVVGDTVRADMTVAEVESVFKTNVRTVKSTRTGKLWHRAGDLHFPKDVAASVAAVYGLHGLPLPPKAKSGKARSGDSPNVGPTDIRRAYGVTGRGSGSTKVRQAVAEFQGQFSNQQDLTSFFQAYVPNAQPGDDKVYAYKGNVESGYGVEALLDIQYIMGIAPGIKTEFWGWQNQDFCHDLKTWTTTILQDDNGPLVHSVSYGWQGDLSQIGCDDSVVKDIDSDLQSIAAKGVTIIFASGDSGSAFDGSTLWPSWPASSPYVTAVGATAFTDSSMTVESASNQFGSGSGFSSLFGQTAWQRAAVQGYLTSQASNLPPSSVWTRNGRASADVSALGEGYNVYVEGQVEVVGGTSAATPTFAAIISLINDKLVGEGKSPLGYLNPWIYNNTGAFRDVTRGSDKIDRNGDPLEYGFDCTTGWDPATGNGSPKFPQLVTAAGA